MSRRARMRLPCEPGGTMSEQKKVRSATNDACLSCPWRVANQGKRVAGGWYSKANLRRLWGGMRRGERMSCHPTDPRIGIEHPGEGPAGFRPAPEEAEPRECAGAVAPVRRELLIFDRI